MSAFAQSGHSHWDFAVTHNTAFTDVVGCGLSLMGNMRRREFFTLLGCAAVLRIARAESYPSRPVRLIVPFGSAGATDIVARLIGQYLSERLSQTFIIENRPGAGGNLGIETVVRSPPDGYTLALVGAPSAINATLYDKLSFNFIRDIAPVAAIVRFPNVMVVNPSVPAVLPRVKPIGFIDPSLR
jgi:tripartite-type tricarboxylate transporter receptor subunit TctC